MEILDIISGDFPFKNPSFNKTKSNLSLELNMALKTMLILLSDNTQLKKKEKCVGNYDRMLALSSKESFSESIL